MTNPPKPASKSPQDPRKFPAQHDESYPAGMESAREAPAGIGQDKPGPKNPEPATSAPEDDTRGKDSDQSQG